MEVRAMVEWIDILFDGLRVNMNDELHSTFRADAVTELIHLMELPSRVHVKKRKWRCRRKKRLSHQVKENRTILSKRVQQHGITRFNVSFPDNVNTLGLKPCQVTGH
ncbi:hypothetical protein thsrh120_46350 [Rhizobium sp. No.120]